MAALMSKEEEAAISAARAAARTAVGNRAVEVSRMLDKIKALPSTVAEVRDAYDLTDEEATEALDRIAQLRSMFEADLAIQQERICLLDMMLRVERDTKMHWAARQARMRGLLSIIGSDLPMETYEQVDWGTRAKTERTGLHDAYVSGWGHVTAGTARLVGAYSGATDLITVSTGIDDKGKPVGFGKRAASFLALVGGALLSDAMRSWHLQNLVSSKPHRTAGPRRLGDATPEAQGGRNGPKRTRSRASEDADVATSQTSSKASGTVADIEAMGIPVENFNKIQAECFDKDAHVLVRPSGVETPDQLRRGATPKPMHHKSKTANDLDGLIGANPAQNGACAAFEPNTKFFEDAMRSSGMNDAQIASGLDVLKSGGTPEMPSGFGSADIWQGAASRFNFRAKEWNGPIGDALRKRVSDGASEINGGIVSDLVDGKMRVVAGDHDIFETFIKGRAASDAQADDFWQTLKGQDAGVQHGGHARFDPKPEDYGPGGRFEVDTKGYSPDAAAAKIQKKFESDRNIYEVIMDKHSAQQLPDDILAKMDGFVPPKRSHYPEGPYGDMRHRQDASLHERWEFLQSGAAGPLPERAAAEVLVMIGPVGPPVIVRAGDMPGNVTPAVAQPTVVRPGDFGPIAPGSPGVLPRELQVLTGPTVRTVPILWDETTHDWFDAFGKFNDPASPECLPEPDLLLTAPTRFPWKPVAAAGAGLALIGGAFAVIGGDDEPAPVIAVPVVSVLETVRETTSPPPTTALVILDDPVESAPPSTVPDPVPSTTPLISVGPATRFGLANPCAAVTHSPHPNYLSYPSYFSVSGVVGGVDGEVEPGTMLTVTVQDSAMEPFFAPIGADHVVRDIIVPIDRFGFHRVDFAVDGAPVDGSPFLEVQVDAAEGPVGGCTPANDLDPVAIDDLVGTFAGTALDPNDDPLVDDTADDGDDPPLDPLSPPVLPGAVVPDPIPAPEDDLAPYREFFTRFETAHRSGDTDFLMGTLHPAVLTRYGAEQCAAYIDSVVGTVSNMRVVDGMTEPWDFPLDGRTAEIAGAVTLDVDAQWVDAQFTASVHLARVDDDLAWFADCGEPL